MSVIFQKIFDRVPERFLPLFESARNYWEPLDRLEQFIATNLRPGNRGVLKGQARIEENVEIGEGTVIEEGAVIKGPTIIGKKCEIRAHAYIRGNVIIGDECVVGHTTEIVRSVFFDNVRADHFNYVGDSILGNGVHLGSGAKTANLRFDRENIVFDGIPTGRRKFGALLGDQSQLGVNVSIGPGVVFEKGTWLTSKDQLKSGVYARESFRQKK